MLENNTKILFVCPMPPPVHGSSMVSQSIKESSVLNDEFEMDFVNLSTSRTMEEIDKRSWSLYARKAVRFIGAYAKTLWLLTTRKYDLCYLAITCHGVGFLKDAPFVLLCKLFRHKVVIHQHNKGMAKDVDRHIYRWLLPMVYRNTKVILLSWRLYADIEKVVKREQVMICPNGIPDTNSKITSAERHNDVPHILFLSNLIVSKGVLDPTRCAENIKRKGMQIRLQTLLEERQKNWMVGDLHWRLKQGDWMISPCIMAGNMAKIRRRFCKRLIFSFFQLSISTNVSLWSS